MILARFDVLERRRFEPLVDHELLDLMGLVLAVDRNVHGHAGFLMSAFMPSMVTNTAEASIWLVIMAATLGGPPIRRTIWSRYSVP